MVNHPITQQHGTGGGNNPGSNQLIREYDTDNDMQSVSKRLKVKDTEQDISPLEYALHSIRLQRLEESPQPIFISPMAKANLQARDDALFPLMEKIQEFLASEREVMLILGDSGAGKSTINRHLEHQLWTGYKQGGSIPLHINLPGIYNPAQDMIEKQLHNLNLSDEHIHELKECRQLILICDGYDESQLTVNLYNANRLNQLGKWQAKMIISCRSQFLGSDYSNRFVPEITDHHKAVRMDLFQEAVIAPFSERQVEDYVEQYVPLEPRIWVTEDYMRMLTKIPNLMDLVRNPFLLTLALEVLPAITKQKEDFLTIRITRVHLYDIFVVHWLNVNKRRLESNTLSADDRIVYDHLLDAGFIYMGIDYSTRLASAIFEKQDGNPLVQYIHVQDQNTWKAKFFGMDPEVRLLQESAPLTRSGNHFLFVHRSMQEYFLSRVIYSPVETDENEFDPQVETAAPTSFLFDGSSPLFQRNLLEESSIIQFLCDRVNLHPEFEEHLRAIIEQSKTDASATIAATNAITILVKAGANFNGADLRNVKIPGADLSGGQFDSVQFQGANLSNTNLAGTWLRQANLSGAQMEGVQFGELPYIEAGGFVKCCAYSLDGKLLAMGLRKGGVEIYDTSCWKRVYQLCQGHFVSTVAFSPDIARIVSGGMDGILRLWDCGSGNEVLAMMGHASTVTLVAYSPCGKQVASASKDKTVRLWDAQTGEELFVLKGHTEVVNSVKFSPDGQQLASGGDRTVRFWDPKTGESGVVLSCSLGHLESLAYSPDGRWIASGHWNGSLQLWNATSHEPGPILQGHTEIVSGIAFSPNSQLMASSSRDRTVRLWDASTGASISKLEGHGFSVCDVAFSPDGSQLASVSDDGTVRLWEVNSKPSISGQKDYIGHARGAAYSPDGRYIISSDFSTVQQRDATTGAPKSVLFKFPRLSVESVAFSSDGKRIVTSPGLLDNILRLWDCHTGAAGPVLKAGIGVHILKFSPCCRWIGSVNAERNMRLWDLHDPEQHSDFEIPLGEIRSIAFPPDGRQFATGSFTGDVSLLDPKSGVLLVSKKLNDHLISTLAYSPNGQQLAMGFVDHSICLWDLQSDAASVRLQGHKGGILCIAYSPCGQWIASSSYDKTLRLWHRQLLGEVESWSCVSSIRASFKFILDVVWNSVVPMEFITVCEDRALRAWRVSSNEEAVAVTMLWGTNLEVLCADGLNIQDVEGLSLAHQKLLVQRGAIELQTEADKEQ